MSSELQTDGLIVIGAGLMRTGTNSLQVALQRLLNGKCYHMYSVFENPHDADFWRAAVTKNPTSEEWRKFLKDYNAAVDLPVAAFYQELMTVYPKAKIVLSVRDPQKWFQSVSTTIAPTLAEVKKFPLNILSSLIGVSRTMTMINAVHCRVLRQQNCDFTDKERMIAAYHRHVEEVRRVVPADRLLEFEAKDGWEPLCNFLGLEVPSDPYPYVNTGDEFKSRLTKMRIGRAVGIFLLLLISSGLVYLTARFMDCQKLSILFNPGEEL